MDGTMDLTGKTELELRAMEREIAKQHLDKFPYLSLAWGLEVAHSKEQSVGKKCVDDKSWFNHLKPSSLVSRPFRIACFPYF